MAAKKAMPREYHGAMVDECYPQDKQTRGVQSGETSEGHHLSIRGYGPRPTEGTSHGHGARRTAEGMIFWGCGGGKYGVTGLPNSGDASRVHGLETPASFGFAVFGFETRRGGVGC